MVEEFVRFPLFQGGPHVSEPVLQALRRFPNEQESACSSKAVDKVFRVPRYGVHTFCGDDTSIHTKLLSLIENDRSYLKMVSHSGF